MKYYKEYKKHIPIVVGKKNKFDNTIFTFDIETSSYYIKDGKVIAGCNYETLNKKEQQEVIKQSTMYIWQFSINDIVYYGRTWQEFDEFLKMLEEDDPYRKIVFVHNLSFEFQYLKGYFKFEDVMARKSRKVMRAFLQDFNIEFRCSYMMSNVKLEKLPSIYNLPVEKQVGSLNYDLLRTSITELNPTELKYCEYDCLVVYEYIKVELKSYENIDKIPLTSTGHVRRELRNLTQKDYSYRKQVMRASNTNPHVYNLLLQSFMGGYTHANWLYTDELLHNIDSWDFTSSYPYVLVSYKYPAFEFKQCNITNVEQMSKKFAYLLVVKFTNLKSKFYNNFLSSSKCRHIFGGQYDNGRIISADSLEITLTDVDFYLLLDSYYCEYEIIECYYSLYKYLPKKFINFILDKYEFKTQYKGLAGKELEYQLEKAKFNALYGMSVTNTIRDDVKYSNDSGWSETELSNEEIIEKLEHEKKKGFLSFSWGVWVTAYARRNLLTNVCKMDDNVVYCDTDSIKLVQRYKKKIILDYNKSVKERIKRVSKLLKIPIENYEPKDIKGKRHLLGVFECETDKGNRYTYDEFITQGAKKYATRIKDKIKITVAGVPKGDGSKALKSLNDFRDKFIFKASDTGKQTLMYLDDQEEDTVIDKDGNKYINRDITGCCMIPCSYELGKSLDYCELLTDNSSKRAVFREEVSRVE